MVYHNKLVAVVKADGKILREMDGCVYVPFGSEYSLYLKNMESRKALVKIEIDGKHIGHDVIIPANSPIEIQRWLEGLNSGSRFKFIQKTEKISQYRGDKIEDGLVRIEYQFEKQRVCVNPPYQPYVPPFHPWYSSSDPYFTWQDAPVVCKSSMSIGSDISGAYTTCNINAVSPEGITVKGSDSYQQFHYGNIGMLEETKNVIVLQLRGVIGTMPIQAPITVHQKQVCDTCGTKSQYGARFCPECGTALMHGRIER